MNMDKAAAAVFAKFQAGEVLVHVSNPAGDGKIQSYLRANARIVSEEYLENQVIIEAKIGKSQLAGLKRLKPFEIKILEA